jgi:transposase-like protein
MENVERKKPRPRRSFTAEFKAEIVELCQRGDRSVGQVARDFDLTEDRRARVGPAGRARRWDTQRRVDQRRAGRARGVAAGEPPAARRRRDPQAGHGFLREGDPVNVYPFIEAEKEEQRNVKRACELLQVSRAAFYADRGKEPSSSREQEDAELAEVIKQVHDESKGRYSAPRIHAELRRAGRRHGRKRVARLMRAGNIRGRTPRRWKKTTIPDPAARADLIRRDFSTDANMINARWCGDITYVPTWEGWLYLATVLDIASRRVVGFAMADHLRTELVADALANAVAARNPGPGLIFHSDRGCQYTSAQFAALADECVVTLSVGRTGQ